jgi:hypothetical protein
MPSTAFPESMASSKAIPSLRLGFAPQAVKMNQSMSGWMVGRTHAILIDHFHFIRA